MASASSIDDDMMDVVNRTTRYQNLSEEERRQMEERLAICLAGADGEAEEINAFEGDDVTDPDYVPTLEDAASDAETETVIETETPYDDDEDLEYLYEGAAAAPEALEAVYMDEEPRSASSIIKYRSKDGKLWSSAPPCTGRLRAHNCAIVGREGPAPGIMRSPVSIFKSIITPEIVSIIVRETNRKAQELCRLWCAKNPDQTPRTWTKSVTENEIYAFFGLTLFAGIFGSNSQPALELWGNNGNPIYRATMSAHRYKIILQYIRFDNGNTRHARLLESKSAAIDDIWNMLMSNLERLYVPGAQITIDEQLFPYRGHTRFTQYIPSKPAKYGIKVWWMCDANSNYPLKGIIYVGKQANEARAVNQGENVVLKLVEKYAGSGRTIYADNFFSSFDLATALVTKRLAYVGTMRKNKACIPKEMLDPKRDVFSTVFGYHNNNIALCSYVPKKKKVVVLISTEHYNSAVDSSKPSKKPFQILDYNKYKSGVDTMDQMVSGNTCKRGTNRWPLALFYNMLDVAGLAAFVIHDKLGHVKRTDRRRVFLMELAEQLVVPHMEQRATNPIVRGIQHVKEAMALFGVEVAAGPPIDDQPVHAVSSATRPSCSLCYKLDKKQRKTRFHCMYCKKPVCQQHSHAKYACVECRA
ncbi:piggyBac transposable element-derived protein 4-like [Rhagoletis pomonella]|uniref:piggyBac transposable element-derived protein 4-like n=1 Tax=Rhagoletis pomonella TaxID=28610 RepID=UPI00177C7B4D|nr:piggyBac transposable element-derived protein 4-like [Rhagoletis pomonella]